MGVVTALCPIIGYTKSAELAKLSLKIGVPVTTLAVDQGLLTADRLKTVLDPYTMTIPAYTEQTLKVSIS